MNVLSNDLSWRNILNEFEMPVLVKNSSLAYVWLNKAAYKWLEREENEVIGKTDYEVYDRSMADLLRQLDQKVLATEKPDAMRITMYKKDDEATTIKSAPMEIVTFRTSLIIAETNETYLLQQVNIKPQNEDELSTKLQNDISRQLTETYDLIKSIQQLTNIGFLEYHPVSKLVRWSDNLLNICGMSETKASMGHLDYINLIAEDYKPKFEQYLQNTLEKREPFDYITPLILPNKQTKWVRNVGNVMVDENDTVIKLICIVQDITQSIETQNALKQSEATFRSVFENAPMGIVLSETKGKFIKKINKRFVSMLGYLPNELDNKSIEEVTHPEDRDIQLHLHNQTLTTNETTFALEKRYIRKDGSILWANTAVSVVKDDDGHEYYDIVMIHDITKRKTMELTVQRKNNELDEKNQQLQKYIDSNLQLESFAYIASHDLREPLRTINGFSKILLQKYSHDLDAIGIEYLTYITNAAQGMNQLIVDLLEYSRINYNENEIVEINIKNKIEKIIILNKATITQSNAQITCQNMPKSIKGNRTRIYQLFQNLILNAIKFRKPNIAPIIAITCQDKTNYWQFAITDNGIGIEKDYLEKIFLIFKKLHTKTEYDGSGIGLAICKKIVQQHGGDIWAESELGVGATFYFTLPK
jgi:PAS domain S-box-containing protein